MKDIPIFTTDCGVSSIILKEIPYREIAYIHIQDLQPGGLEEHLKECVGFCRAAGAERIYASGHEELTQYPLHTVICQMALALTVLPQPKANLFPVTEETVGRFREYYNKGMVSVDNAATLTAWDERQILTDGGAYFVHEDGGLLGIGWMKGSELAAIVSVKPGAGETIAQTLFTLADSDRITLEVASTNHKAIRLYEKLGFIQTGERSRWYQVF